MTLQLEVKCCLMAEFTDINAFFLTFCKHSIKTISHLLFVCEISPKLWTDPDSLLEPLTSLFYMLFFIHKHTFAKSLSTFSPRTETATWIHQFCLNRKCNELLRNHETFSLKPLSDYVHICLIYVVLLYIYINLFYYLYADIVLYPIFSFCPQKTTAAQSTLT